MATPPRPRAGSRRGRPRRARGRRRLRRAAARPRRPRAARRTRRSTGPRTAARRSPKCRRIATRRQPSPSTKPQTARYCAQLWRLGLRVLGLVDEEDVEALVLPVREQDAPRRQPVAPRAAGLLVVGLERRGHRLVDDGAHVRLVDAHAERVRRHDHGRLTGHERALRLGAGPAVHPGVVGGDRLAELAAQPLRRRLGALARARVDDRRQRAGLRQERRDRALTGSLARTGTTS